MSLGLAPLTPSNAEDMYDSILPVYVAPDEEAAEAEGEKEIRRARQVLVFSETSPESTRPFRNPLQRSSSPHSPPPPPAVTVVDTEDETAATGTPTTAGTNTMGRNSSGTLVRSLCINLIVVANLMFFAHIR